MSKSKFTNIELIAMDLASTEVALFEVNINYEHYREEKNRLEQKKAKLIEELKRLKKGPKREA